MNSIERVLPDDNLLFRLFSLGESQESERESHFADDPEQVYRWNNQLLDPETATGCSRHLAGCERCRKELADMLSLGVLTLDSDGSSDESSTISLRTPHSVALSHGFAHRFLISCGVAAVLIGVLFVAPFWNSRPTGDLASRTVDRRSSDDWKTNPAWMLPESNRQSTAKGFSPEIEQPLPERFVENSLESGLALWESKRLDESQRVFVNAEKKNANEPYALLGLGLVDFERKDYQKALERFDELISKKELEPMVGLFAHINAALCCERLGSLDDEEHWNTALALTETESIRDLDIVRSAKERIRRELERIEQIKKL